MFEKNWIHALEIHLLGACGEIAVAKLLDRYPEYSVNRFSGQAGDLQEHIEVRHRSNDSWDLKVTESDADERIFVLTTGLPPDIIVHGWCMGWDAKQAVFKKDYGDYDKPAYFVPQSELRSPLTLLQVIRER